VHSLEQNLPLVITCLFQFNFNYSHPLKISHNIGPSRMK